MSDPRRAAVLGHPVAHSLSPVLHRAAYAALGLDWRYEARDVTPEQLPAVISGLDGSWAGLSLTMPLKQTVLGLLDHVEPLAEVVGAANTVLVQPGGSRPVLVGANTDVPGLVAALGEAGVTAVGRAVVLGAGATAASTLAALAQLGCTSPEVRVRSIARAGGLLRAARRMGVDPRLLPMAPMSALVGSLAAADVVVSTLPPLAADPIALALDGVAVGGVLLDCVYDPRPTALGVAWVAARGVVVGGERLLLHQAAEQVRLMTGRTAPLAEMDAALTEALSREEPPAG